MKNKKYRKNNLDRKKGFTLIEIIISIVLLVLIGGTTTFLLLNKKDDKENEVTKVTNQVLEAANVYVNTMKDKNGNSFLTEISKGAKGVKIPISLLVDKGLIDKKVSNDLEDYLKEKYPKNNENDINEQYYILYLQGGTTDVDYCEEGPFAIPSWTMNDSEGSLYLCNDYDNDDDSSSGTDPNQEFEPNIVEAQKSVRLEVELNKYAVSQDFYDQKIKNNASLTTEQKKLFTTSENGVFTFYNEDTKKIFWYYRGAVNNNYLKFGKYKTGDKKEQPLYWRILWMNNKNEMKIVLDDTIL